MNTVKKIKASEVDPSVTAKDSKTILKHLLLILAPNDHTSDHNTGKKAMSRLDKLERIQTTKLHGKQR